MRYLPLCCLLFQIMLGLMHLGSANGLTVQVSEHGRDEQSCFHDSISCKTLTYALRLIETTKITNVLYASVTVNVTYNQTINTSHFYNLSSSSVRNVTIVGYNDICLYFQANGSLRIYSLNSNSGLAWVWEKLEFVRKSPQVATCKIPALQQVGVYGDTLSTFQCKFKSIGWSIYGIQNIVINGNVFGATGLCTSVCISNTGKSDNEGVVMILHNDFQNCLLSPNFAPYPQARPSVLAILNARFTSTKILSNKFSGLSFSKKMLFQSAIRIQGTPTAIVLKKNVFVGNSLAFVDISVNVTNVSMHNNTFHHNQLQPKPEPGIINIVFGSNSTYYNTSFEMSIINNDFKSNINSLIFITLNHTSNTILSIILTDLVVVNNSGTSELITIKSYLKPIVCMEMALLQVENNNAHFKADFLEISRKKCIIKLVNIKLFLIDSSFKKNLDTSLLVQGFRDKHLQLCVLGTTAFQQNSGYMGGALSLLNVIVNSSCEGTLLFEKNEGVYGGALYLNNVKTNMLPSVGYNMCNVTLSFVDNSARTAGNSIYYAYHSAKALEEGGCLLLHSNVNRSDIRTAANRMSFQNRSTVFPGQTIFLNVTVRDYFNNPSSCSANVFILCNTQFSCFDFPVKLSGPDKILLTSDSATYTVNTNMAVQSLKYPDLTEKFSLVLACKKIESAHAIIHITVTRCPNGFHYNTNTRMCQCAGITKNMVCSIKLGAACIAHGYWYGELVVNEYNFTEYTVSQCAYSECKYSNVPCPPEMQSSNGFFMLNFENDSQCSYGRGGVLCRKCAQNFVFSFLSINCISEINCYSWQPFLIVFFGIFFQVLIATFLLLVVRFKHALGSGFLYGPMLFLAVVSHLPLDNYSEFSTLTDAVSIFTSIPLLNLKLFGRIPWCFFIIPKMYNYSLRFLGPVTVLVVLVSIAIFAQRCPFNSHCLRNACPQNALQCWKAPPLKAVCILMLLSFWSLADTSINILTPTVFEFRESPPLYMVSIQPDIRYFSPQHLPAAIPALLVLLVLILPLVTVLLLSPFLQRVINLHRIMPFLDEFQSCYEDQYRWYSGVYFVVWIIIVGIQGLPDFLLYTQTIFIILLCAQFLIKPYKSKLLNITDTLLLVDINFLISLFYKRTYSSSLSHVHMFSNLLVHTLVIVPPVCAIVSVTCVLLIKCSVYERIQTLACLKRRQPHVDLQPSHSQGEQQQQQSSHVTVQDVWIQHDHDSVAEREPLIGIVNDN